MIDDPKTEVLEHLYVEHLLHCTQCCPDFTRLCLLGRVLEGALVYRWTNQLHDYPPEDFVSEKQDLVDHWKRLLIERLNERMNQRQASSGTEEHI